jgi:predicted ATP-grasp superfamily ATP-dependent carboligase
MIDARKPLRVLVPEGSSTSGREAITILGLAGHHVEVCDPSRWCLARYSRFVRKFHHCPGLRTDPAGFLRFVERLLASQHFDVLLPTHEQGLLFARAETRLKPRAGLALPDFDAYRTVHGKAGFSRLLDQLDLPQPATQIVRSADELREAVRFPCVIKTSVGTASRGVWFVRDAGDLNRALYDLGKAGDFVGEVLAQDLVTGTTEKAQSVFCHGRLLGFHAYRQVAAGIGGGEAIKESVSRPAIRTSLERIGAHLGWHGALSVDVVMPLDSATPLLIDCNPRLVEPVNAYRAGTDLVDLLLRVSRGEAPAPLAESRVGVRTHLAMQALLGSASRDGTRRDIVRECGRMVMGRGAYQGSTEELTPVSLDWLSAVPLAMTATLLLASPQVATRLARGGFGAHLLDRASIEAIESEDFSPVVPGKRSATRDP